MLDYRIIRLLQISVAVAASVANEVWLRGQPIHDPLAYAIGALVGNVFLGPGQTNGGGQPPPAAKKETP